LGYLNFSNNKKLLPTLGDLVMQTVRGEYDRSKRLEVIGEADAERRSAIEATQKEIAADAETGGRRDFLTIVVAALGGLLTLSVLYPIARYSYPPERKKKATNSAVVGKESEIPPNTGKIVKFNDLPVMIVNKGGELTAMSAKCTHLGCLVQWDAKAANIWCACHNARYNNDGTKISGPQPADLQKYAVKVQDGNIVVSKA
jgi:cytochrome b6-f complex iron-sulfur subunit